MEAKGSKGSGPNQGENQEKKNQTGDPKQEAEIQNSPSKPASVVTPGKSSKEIDSPIIFSLPYSPQRGSPVRDGFSAKN
jgi:hypothetical protein